MSYSLEVSGSPRASTAMAAMARMTTHTPTTAVQ